MVKLPVIKRTQDKNPYTAFEVDIMEKYSSIQRAWVSEMLSELSELKKIVFFLKDFHSLSTCFTFTIVPKKASWEKFQYQLSINYLN